MSSEKMIKELNEQLNKELFSSYLYLSMAAHFDNNNYSGFANWMRLQAQEEYDHAMKFYDFTLQIGGKVTLELIEKPKNDWDSCQQIFEEALEHEIFITDAINKLASVAQQENDFATANFIQWFVNEQVEEVSTVETIVHKFKMIDGNKSGLYLLDNELGTRVAAQN